MSGHTLYDSATDSKVRAASNDARFVLGGEGVKRHNKLEISTFICEGFEKIIFQIIASNTTINTMRFWGVFHWGSSLELNPPGYRITQFYELSVNYTKVEIKATFRNS